MGRVFSGRSPERGFAGALLPPLSWHHTSLYESLSTYREMRRHLGGCPEGRGAALLLW